MRLIGFAAVLLIAISSGCGGDGRPRQTHTVRFDVGGSVAYELDPSEALGGVRVTLGDIDGRTFVATTNSAGLWTIRDLDPGVYSEVHELVGYERATGSFALDAFGENNVSNPFVSRPTVLMQETLMRASVEPFGAELLDASDLIDGIGGVAAMLDLSASEDIVINLSLPLFGSGYAVLEDASSSDLAIALLDSATQATFTISAAAIAAMNGGSGLTADSNPQTRHTLYVSGDAVTPIHGTPVSLVAELHFNAIP